MLIATVQRYDNKNYIFDIACKFNCAKYTPDRNLQVSSMYCYSSFQCATLLKKHSLFKMLKINNYEDSENVQHMAV